MREVGVRELKSNLSAYLHLAARGEQVRVTRRGRPLADILPTGAPDDKLRRLAAEGRVTLPTKPKPARPPKRIKVDVSGTDLVLEGREEDR
jgi:prevent-host-death family protein